MVKDFIDTNDFSAKELLDMIQLSLSIKDAIRGGYYPPLMKNRNVPAIMFIEVLLLMFSMISWLSMSGVSISSKILIPMLRML